jgi:nicotinate-nucleotide adenylyltransferase
MPANTAPHKPASASDPGAEHRLRMCELAVAALGHVTVCDLEVRRTGPSYTVDTLRLIHDRDPDARLTFVLGADVASTLASWREPAELLNLASLAVARRQGTAAEVVLEHVLAVNPQAHVSFLDLPRLEVSSSQVREDVEQGRPIVGLVGEAVAAYIDEHRLYRQAASVVGVPR